MSDESLQKTPVPKWKKTGDVLEPLNDENVNAPELIFTPKSSATSTAKGTVFYDSDDDHLYVQTG